MQRSQNAVVLSDTSHETWEKTIAYHEFIAITKFSQSCLKNVNTMYRHSARTTKIC